jgi:hypothetical protein
VRLWRTERAVDLADATVWEAELGVECVVAFLAWRRHWFQPCVYAFLRLCAKGIPNRREGICSKIQESTAAYAVVEANVIAMQEVILPACL